MDNDLYNINPKEFKILDRQEYNEKIIVAVPGIDIEEIIQVITKEGKI